MRKSLINILLIAGVTFLVLYILTASIKRDEVTGLKFDSCVKMFEESGAPEESYESIVKDCMDENKYK